MYIRPMNHSDSDGSVVVTTTNNRKLSEYMVEYLILHCKQTLPKL